MNGCVEHLLVGEGTPAGAGGSGIADGGTPAEAGGTDGGGGSLDQGASGGKSGAAAAAGSSEPGTGGSAGQASAGTGGSGGGAAPSGGTAGESEGGSAGSECSGETVAYLNVVRQSELEAVRGLGAVTGELVIGGAVDDLAPLACLTRAGTLKIEDNVSLRTLRGLSSLQEVGVFELYNNQLLADISALSSTAITSRIRVERNRALQSLVGLEGAVELPDGLYLIGDSTYTSLAGLDQLVRVGQFFITTLPNLTSLEGLENLTSVDALGIASNPELVSIGALQKLERVEVLDINYNEALSSLGGIDIEVGRSLSIVSNALESISGIRPTGDLDFVGIADEPLVKSLESFAGLTSVDTLSIELMEGLTTLRGLDNLTTVWSTIGGEGLVLNSNQGLVSLEGLGSLTKAGRLEIAWHGALTTLEGLNPELEVEGLILSENPVLGDISAVTPTAVGGDFGIFECDALTSVAGLETLTEVGYFTVKGNDALVSLRGFEGLASVANNFEISGNSALPNCEALWLRDRVGRANIAGTIRISDNGDGTCDP
ncbi:MAG TPA: hypothetical protein VGK73_25470 [Polyangiaceae bacterium]